MTYDNASTGAPPTASFTRLIPMLRRRWPHLEFIFFKKCGKAEGLLAGGAIEADEHGNVLGPIPFLTPQNTTIIAAAGPPPPPPCADAHYGVEFADIHKYYQLGVRGMEYLKRALGAEAIDVLVLGLGGVVKKENELIAVAPHNYPQRTIVEVEVTREPSPQR